MITKIETRFVNSIPILFVACLFVSGCSNSPEAARSTNDHAEPSVNRNSFAENEKNQAANKVVNQVVADERLKLSPPAAQPVAPLPSSTAIKKIQDDSFPASDNEPKTSMKRSAARRMVSERPMAVMSAAEVDSELPPSQTTINVFYATDRKSEFGISPNEWLEIHFSSIIALLVYLVTFGAVFISSRKALFGTVAFAALIVFLVLGQSANLEWQKQKRMAAHGDASYLSEIRSMSSEGVLDYGTCEVTIPPDHKVGHLDSPSLFKLEFSEDPEKHIVLHRVVRENSKDNFYDGLNRAIDKSNDKKALVFVHGYNVSFESAVKRTAQIVHDLKFDGAPICYSWSSHGAIANYTKDMANADATVLALQSFLEETVQRTGNSTIHLVAHSMGNRALLQSLDRIAVGNRRTEKMFGQLVMAAPDVSAGDFKNRFAPSAMRLASSVTLYASSRDRALLASTEIHGHNRAGLAGPNLVVMEGMDTIDVSEIDTSLIGHSYYGDHPELIKDLRALVELSQPASKRNWLTRIINPGSNDYFQFSEHIARSSNDGDFGPARR